MKKKTNIKNIIYYFLVSILIIIILLIFFLFGLYLKDYYTHKDNGKLKRPLYSFYIIVSGSMNPTIHINDGVFLKRLDHDQYKVGDIITFLPEEENYRGMTVTHRIVKKEKISDDESVYTTKGDNNSKIDIGKVSTKSIYGKVLFIIPRVGSIKDFFLKPINYLYIVGVIVIGIVIINRKKIFKL